MPPLQPTLYGDVKTFGHLESLELALRILLALQILAFLQNAFLKGRSLQSLFALYNAMSLVAHTALFSICSTPGNAALTQRLIMRYYSFKYEFFAIGGAFTQKPAHS